MFLTKHILTRREPLKYTAQRATLRIKLLIPLIKLIKKNQVCYSIPELDPGESLAVLNSVGLPPVQSCVQDTLPIIALGDVQLSLHCTEPVVCLEWVRHVGERQRVTPQKLRTPVAGLRWWRRRRLRVNLLQCLNSVVQGGHHLHLELEVLLRGQRRRHRDPSTLVVLPLVVLPLLVRTTPGVHHLI